MKRTVIISFLFFVTLTVMAQLTNWQNLANKDFVSRIIHDENFLYVGTFGGGIIKIDKQAELASKSASLPSDNSTSLSQEKKVFRNMKEKKV